MTIEDVKKLFNDDDTITIENNAKVRVDKFAELFSEANSNPSYQELVDIDEKNNYGYKNFFDKFKNEGILS